MGAIEHLTIRLPADVVARLRERVNAGEFADESAAIEEALAGAETERASDTDSSAQDWLRRKIRSALADYEADPTCALSVEQVRESLAASRAKRTVAPR